MRILSLLIFCVLQVALYGQTVSPHGSAFKVSCKTCHSSSGWQLDKKGYSFKHNNTKMPLVGQHSVVDCKQCHPTLKFAEAKTKCNECHIDVHQSTTGPDCSRCHTPSSWLVNNINGIHQMSRFPLLGPHRTADCFQCHKSESLARFDVPGVNCIDCHRETYMAVTTPNHFKAGFPEDCIFCHPINSVQWAGVGFNHNIFPLEQGHLLAKCADCHTTGSYSNTSPDCYSCHQKDYLSSKTPDHNLSLISKNCQDCHSLSPGWKPVKFDHSTFPRTLGHSSPICIDCHKGGNYTTTPTDCFSCHQKDFLATTNPNHFTSGISKTCETCHSIDPGWKPVKFDHSSFPRTLGHSTPTCIECHVGGNYTTTPTNCYSCHQKDYLATTNPNHNVSGISKTCEICHTTNPGWKPVKFNHASFPRTLGHSIPACIDCHIGGNFTTTPTDCYSCHQKNYLATTNPNHTTSGISKNCETCHTLTPGWKPTTINHSRFPLTLGHSSPTCIECHIGGNYTTTPTDCYSCHQKDFLSTTNPNHNTSGFSKICQTCHTVNPGWKPTTINHSSFPLTLGHSAPACIECHIGGNYTTTPTDCYSCHQKDFLSTTNPNHNTSGFSKICQTCHTVNPGWKPATFNHISFPLTLGHSTPACIECHVGGNYTTTSSDCYSCHQKDFLAATIPNHTTNGFSKTCQTCHSVNPGWKPTTFNHSRFPLSLGHSAPACIDCHTGGNYTTTPIDCYSCHQKNYLSTTNPNHTTNGFTKICQICHSINPGWKPVFFVHTGFPLTLGHSTPACIDCHTGGNYRTIPIDCFSCHQKDFLAATKPNHTTNGFSKICQTCHTLNPGWKPTVFNHSIFPLTLGHSAPACIDCHVGGNYTTTPIDCYSCHQQDYLTATNPNHSTNAFSKICQTCHTVNPGWKPATFVHTTFPLTLGHSTPACIDCHVGGNYTTTPIDCYSCHQQDYLTALNPNHSTNAFSKICQTCHTINTGWKPATFVHTTFPLTLGHSTPACIDCHIGGNYTTTSTDCYSCHKIDYDNTINPKHKTLSFSITCTQCHTTNPGWKPASYAQHDTQFPIYSGRHKGQWSLCTECHTNTSYSLFTCITCHEHNKADMDSAHRGRTGYSYDSAACFRCHPRGNT